MFKARTSRTLLTILGMGVGISAILFLVALGYGIQKTLLETITTEDSLLSLDVYPGEVNGGISSDEINLIKMVPGVKLVSPVSETAAQMKYNDLMSDVKVDLTDGIFLQLDGLKITGGKNLSENDRSGIVISDSLAKIFDKTAEAMIGEDIKIYFPQEGVNSAGLEANFKIVGTVEKKDIIIYANQKSLEGFLPITSWNRLKIKCSNSRVMAEVRNQLTAGGFMVSALTDTINQVEKTFRIVRIILGLFGAIALLVSAIGMFNTMVVTLLERTEEIGIMKAIGASDNDILCMFVFESTIMGFLGGIIGIILGFIAGEFFNMVFNFLAQRFGGIAISLFYFPGWFMGEILLAAVLVGFFTGLIPARKASITDPLEALRYK